MGTRVICIALFLYSTLVNVSSYVNEYDQPFDFKCPSSQIIGSIYSRHHNKHEDRQWDFHCRSVDNTNNCTISGYVNDWDKPLAYICPDQGVLTGVASYHDNGFEDRLFSFQCCKVGNRTTKNCYITPYVNDWDGILTLNVPGGRAIKGAYSYHDNYKEDRRWKFEICDI